VRESKRKVAVVGEQEQPRGIRVQPADGKKPVTAVSFVPDHVEHRRPI